MKDPLAMAIAQCCSCALCPLYVSQRAADPSRRHTSHTVRPTSLGANCGQAVQPEQLAFFCR